MNDSSFAGRVRAVARTGAAAILAAFLSGCVTRGVVYPLGRTEAPRGYVDLYEFYVTENSVGTYWNTIPFDCRPVLGGASRSVRYNTPLTRFGFPAGRYRFSRAGTSFDVTIEPGRIQSCCIYTFKDTATTTYFGNSYTISVQCRIREIGSVTDPAVNAAACQAELLDLLRSGTEIKQYYACLVLAQCGDAESIPALQQLKAQDDRFRFLADRAVASIRRRAQRAR